MARSPIFFSLRCSNRVKHKTEHLEFNLDVQFPKIFSISNIFPRPEFASKSQNVSNCEMCILIASFYTPCSLSTTLVPWFIPFTNNLAHHIHIYTNYIEPKSVEHLQFIQLINIQKYFCTICAMYKFSVHILKKKLVIYVRLLAPPSYCFQPTR